MSDEQQKRAHCLHEGEKVLNRRSS
jgi:hypothetical protein